MSFNAPGEETCAAKTGDIRPRNEPARNCGGRNCIKASSNHERVRNPISEISFRAWTAEVQRHDNIIPRRGTIRRGRDRLESELAIRALGNKTYTRVRGRGAH